MVYTGWVKEELFQTGFTRGRKSSGQSHHKQNNDWINDSFTKEVTTDSYRPTVSEDTTKAWRRITLLLSMRKATQNDSKGLTFCTKFSKPFLHMEKVCISSQWKFLTVYFRITDTRKPWGSSTNWVPRGLPRHVAGQLYICGAVSWSTAL
jgi:hypothetical protein